MDLVTIIVLAIVQGITEFLPISSSGHLVIVNALLGQGENVNIISIVLHGGALFSILVFYRQRIFKLLYEDWHTVRLLVAATIPTAIIGLFLKSQLEEFLESALLAGLMLPVTGILLWWSDRQPPKQGTYEDLSYKKAVFLGFTQAASVRNDNRGRNECWPLASSGRHILISTGYFCDRRRYGFTDSAPDDRGTYNPSVPPVGGGAGCLSCRSGLPRMVNSLAGTGTTPLVFILVLRNGFDGNPLALCLFTRILGPAAYPNDCGRHIKIAKYPQ